MEAANKAKNEVVERNIIGWPGCDEQRSHGRKHAHMNNGWSCPVHWRPAKYGYNKPLEQQNGANPIPAGEIMVRSDGIRVVVRSGATEDDDACRLIYRFTVNKMILKRYQSGLNTNQLTMMKRAEREGIVRQPMAHENEPRLLCLVVTVGWRS